MVATLSEPGPYLAYSKDSRWQLYTLLGDVAAKLYRQITFSFFLKKEEEKKAMRVQIEWVFGVPCTASPRVSAPSAQHAPT